MGAYYTPEEVTGFMARNTIHPYILEQLNEEIEGSYEDVDEIFGLDDDVKNSDKDRLTMIGKLESINRDHIERLYFDILKDLKVLDPAVGSGAFLLAAEEVLLDIYLSCIDYFQRLQEERSFELTDKIMEELEKIDQSKGNETLYTKRSIILGNLHGVDIEQ